MIFLEEENTITPVTLKTVNTNKYGNKKNVLSQTACTEMIVSWYRLEHGVEYQPHFDSMVENCLDVI